MKLNRAKAMNATTAMTANDWRIRRMMKASTEKRLRSRPSGEGPRRDAKPMMPKAPGKVNRPAR